MNDGWRLSNHARERATEMRVDVLEVIEAAAYPELSYPSTSRQYAGCEVRVRGRLAVPVNAATGMVITVLWNRESERR